MNYELAKKLKDAGFPQKLDTHKAAMNDAGFDVNETPTFPTLSELIEVCGQEFGSVKFSHSITKGRKPFMWFAYEYPEREETTGVGSTPEEAVANLWLALNKTL